MLPFQSHLWKEENVADKIYLWNMVTWNSRRGHGSLVATQKLLRTFTIEFQDQDQQTIQLQLQNLTFQSPPKTAVKSIDPPVHQTNHPNVSSIHERGLRCVADEHHEFCTTYWHSYLLAIKMKHLAAYLLLTLGGNSSPSAEDIKEVLESVGIEADDDRLNTLLSELKGKDINEVCRHT